MDDRQWMTDEQEQIELEARGALACRETRHRSFHSLYIQAHTMKVTQMLDSKYLKRSDLDEFDGEAIVTIRKIGRANIARDDEPEEMKWLMKFAEFDKPLVLNTTNIQLIAQATGCDDTDDWMGKQVILYDDPNVSFGGKLVGGLRIKRVPKAKAAPAAQKPSGNMSDMSDDVPFANPLRGRASHVI
jgi:hypothetical protein